MYNFLAVFQQVWRRALRQTNVTLSIIALLALGIGGVTAIFNPVYSTMFSSLPYPQPDQLVRIGGNIPLFNTITSSFVEEASLGWIFSDMAAYSQERPRIRMPGADTQIEVEGVIVNEPFFETFGVKPLIGYDCAADGFKNGIIVSHRLWRKELDQKTDAIGSHIQLSHERLVPIIGIMPDGFNFPSDTDIWYCRSDSWGGLGGDMRRITHFIGRMRPGVTYGHATKVLQDNFEPVTILQGIITISMGPLLQPLQTYLYGDQLPLLRMLALAAILFLVLVCAGVVNLHITQGAKRKQEIATRLIYGATRLNLVFQLLRETLPLVVIGGLTGWWLSEAGSAWMLAQMPALRGGGGAVDVPVKMAFQATLALVVTLVSGLIPALFATSLDLNTYLKAATGGRRRFLSSQEFLVGIQLSVALALLISVGILIRSMMFNVDIPIGWSTRDIAVVTTAPPTVNPPVNDAGIVPQEYLSAVSRRNAALNQDILNELRSLPEVMNVGLLNPIPFSTAAIRDSRTRWPVFATVPNRAVSSFDQEPGETSAVQLTVNPNGFDILGIPLVAGRRFTEAEGLERIGTSLLTGGLVIINQTLAQILWPEENNVLGKIFFGQNRTSYEVVGVVRNNHYTPGSKDFIPTMYAPYQLSRAEMNVLVKLRPNASLENFHANVRQRLSGFTPGFIEVRRLSGIVKDVTVNQRLTLQLLTCFTVLGIIVSGLAVYATASLAAAARTRETGIRMAMGAQTRDILRLALWRGIRAMLFGLPFGLFLAWILTKLLAKYLVQVNIDDPLMWVISCAVLLVIATVAALIPSLRLTRVNPLDALRDK